MPKKQPKNSFYFFMLDFREQQKKLNIHYPSMDQVASAAGPPWAKLLPRDRAKYEALAKEWKKQQNVPEKKYTSTGQSLADIERQQQERRQAEENERQDIHDFVTQKSLRGDLLDQDMFLMDVNCYCKANGSYIVGEVSLLRLSVRDGIRDFYHQMLNPGPPPIGYASDFKNACEELGLPPVDDGPPYDPSQLLAELVDYLRKRQCARRPREPLPAVYTMPEKVPLIMDFIGRMCQDTSESESMFRVYKLPTLMFTLLGALSPTEALPRESLAMVALKKDAFLFTPGLSCQHHTSHLDGGRACQCTLARVQHWAYTLLDHAARAGGVAPQPGKHMPADFDFDSIQIVRERRSAVAPDRSYSTINCTASDSSALNMSADTSAYGAAAAADSAPPAGGAWGVPTATNTGAKPKRVHVPLRKPKVDYSEQLCDAPPSLDDADFPAFPAPAVSRGRGRGDVAGLNSGFNRMKM